MAAETSTSVNRSLHEDDWSEEATNTLIEAWGKRYIEVNRGNLCKNYWEQIVDTVNSVHGHPLNPYKTMIQCKNRLDTVKKKFKSEQAKSDASKGVFKSSWRFYPRMEFLMGDCLRYQSRSTMPPRSAPLRIEFRNALVPSCLTNGEGCSNAAEEEEEEKEKEEEEMGVEDGLTGLAKVIEGFGEIYERVESMKVKQMVELEKQRMMFAKDLEVHRMKMFVDMQVQLEKMRAKRAGSDDGPSTKRRKT